MVRFFGRALIPAFSQREKEQKGLERVFLRGGSYLP